MKSVPSQLSGCFKGVSRFAIVSSLAGLLVGMLLALILFPKGSANGSSAVKENAYYVSRNAAGLTIVQEYRARNSRTVEDEIEVLDAFDRWLSSDPVDCVNSLRGLGA